MTCTVRGILEKIEKDYKEVIHGESSMYMELNIEDEARKMGCSMQSVPFSRTNVIIPLKKPVSGMKVMIDGRAFVDYAQFNSGLVVPEYVAKTTGLPYHAYAPHESMVLNFT
jgi:hypothetical protein